MRLSFMKIAKIPHLKHINVNVFGKSGVDQKRCVGTLSALGTAFNAYPNKLPQSVGKSNNIGLFGIPELYHHTGFSIILVNHYYVFNFYLMACHQLILMTRDKS